LGGASESPLDRAAGISPGDYVEYHLYGYDIHESLVFTTNQSRAEDEAERGNPHMGLLQGMGQFGVRAGIFELPQRASEGTLARFQPTRYLIGLEPGDRALTPFYLEPFGAPPELALPREIGPVATVTRLDLDALYSAENASAATISFGAREGFRPGAIVPYVSVLDAHVLAVEDEIATVEIVGGDGTELFSEVFGVHLRLRIVDSEAFLEPLVAVGDRFTTQGCNIPRAIIPPGEYQVVVKRPGEWIIQRDLGEYGEFLATPLRFEIHVAKLIQGGQGN
jgi:hypothetical protein